MPHRLEPLRQRNERVRADSAGFDGRLAAAAVAVEEASLAHDRMFAPATVGANEAIEPALGHQRRLAFLIAAKPRLKLS